ncbi:MAG: sulfite exporter TauE/SafE family protein [Verrucomicrobiae bacterium]|nr:sulfite exporter TauE/SafE family protein [Verrucomicrobiae bacterium]
MIELLILAGLGGLAAGTIHVWSGPDHLAAIGPLAIQRPKQAWWPGIRWGLGHSAGVTVIGLLSLWLRDLIPVELLSTWGERMVGVLLIGIGFWALRLALKNNLHTHEHEHDGERHVHIHTHAPGETHSAPAPHYHSHAAFGIGTLHGLAGSSHFLGVLPALAFETKPQAITYLVGFAAGTVLAMALFSWGVGWITTRFGATALKVYRGLMGTAAVAALGVGIFWLATSWG